MADTSADPLSWLVLPERHPVLASDGEVVGYAASVLGDQSSGRFDGIVVGIDERFKVDAKLLLEADQIEDLLTDGIHTKLTADEIRALPEYSPDEAWSPSDKGRVARAVDKLGGDGSSGWDRS
jgi:hypothetical protein